MGSFETLEKFNYSSEARLEKKKLIRRTAVRETGLSRHHGEPIEGPLKPLGIPEQFGVERFKRGL